MKVEDVSIRLTEEEVYILTLAVESYQEELKNIYTDKEEYEEKKELIDAVYDELYSLEKLLKRRNRDED
jgi:hypothetical protein|nr:MAG TPA: hypothetical protein [Caudoviricetes sp.]